MVQLSPYHQSRARQKRLCPECRERLLSVELAGNSPNVAIDVCECGYRHVVEAPKAAHVDYDPAEGDPRQALVDELNGKRRPRRKGRVIAPDFGKRAVSDHQR